MRGGEGGERWSEIHIEGLPILLREEKTYREIARAYSRVIKQLEFTWEAHDVSAGLCLVLHGSRKRIEEEISVTWKNRSFVVWVREVEHQWPPELNWTQMPNREKELGDDGDRQMDIEEGEFRPVGASDSAVAMDTPASPLPANKWEEETCDNPDF
ncbi:hypothetical protein L1987_43751 [Smallanthus sonchifolius]|uniref:Uncharacterized protein n=1 Tax=Smallanthus sonchifolius TaxID=185202 RepID=A0ACB9GN88_9ASTR|nr:hypothetical protein L1987_43751 [Smallanthus sonchifolius]